MIGLCGMSYFSQSDDMHHSSLELVSFDEGAIIEEKTYVDSCEDGSKKLLKSLSDDDSAQVDEMVTLCKMRVSRRTFGLSFAVFNGLWGGSVLIPMHYTK